MVDTQSLFERYSQPAAPSPVPATPTPPALDVVPRFILAVEDPATNGSSPAAASRLGSIAFQPGLILEERKRIVDNLEYFDRIDKRERKGVEGRTRGKA